MDFINRVGIGNLNVGDTLKLSKSGNKYTDGAIIKAEADKCITYELNDDKTIFTLSTANTIIENQEIFTTMTKAQLLESIKIQTELYNQMTN